MAQTCRGFEEPRSLGALKDAVSEKPDATEEQAEQGSESQLPQDIAPSQPQQGLAPLKQEESPQPKQPEPNLATQPASTTELSPKGEIEPGPQASSKDPKPTTEEPDAKKPPRSYEHGFDATHNKAWRKEILGQKLRGPVEWSLAPEADPAKQPLDPVQCKFPDGMVVDIPHLTQEPCQD